MTNLKLQFFFSIQTEYFNKDITEYLDFLIDGVDAETYEQKRLDFAHENGLYADDLPSYGGWKTHHARYHIANKECRDCGEKFLQAVPNKRPKKYISDICECNLSVRIANAL